VQRLRRQRAEDGRVVRHGRRRLSHAASATRVVGRCRAADCADAAVVHERVASARQCADQARASRAAAPSDARRDARAMRAARVEAAARVAHQLMEGVPLAAEPRRRLTLVERLDAYERLMRLDKPIGTLLLLWPTLSALWLAAGGAPRISLLLIFVVGTLVTRSAGCAMNDWADRDFDGRVARTANRPLAQRIIAPWEALVVAAIGALVAFALVLFTNRATMLWSIPALAIAIVYPFVKRFFAIPQAFLGIAFRSE